MKPETEKKLKKVVELVNSGVATTQACKRVGMSTATFYKLKTYAANLDEEVLEAIPGFKNNTGLLMELRTENNKLRKFIKDFL